MTDEDIPDFDRFDHDDARRIGGALADRCRAEGLPVVIDITLGEQRVFHVALPGATADNDAWADRKAAVVRRFDRSSQAVDEHYGVGADDAAFYSWFALEKSRYAVTGGAIPIRVHGALVGVLAVSGLESGGDHELAVEGLKAGA